LIHPDDAGVGLEDVSGQPPKGPAVNETGGRPGAGVLVLPRHRQLDWRKLAEVPVYLTPNHLTRVQG
jgi:hypothetical protein